MVPERIRGAKTDVIETGRIVARVDSTRYRPLIGGGSIGLCQQASAGTLGVVVRDRASGSMVALTNWHVIGGGPPGQNNVAQPAIIDGGVCAGDAIGPFNRASIGGAVDCAIADVSLLATQNRIAELGAVRGTAPAELAMPVQKRGRTTGVTHGRITGLDMTVQVTMPDGSGRTFIRQIAIDSNAEGTAYLLGGDSGSVSMTYGRQIVGLNFASNEAGTRAFANEIQRVVEALDIEVLVSPPKRKESKEKAEKTESLSIDNLRGGLLSDKVRVEGSLLGADLIAGGTLTDPVGPLVERLQQLEGSVDELRHFILQRYRPEA